MTTVDPPALTPELPPPKSDPIPRPQWDLARISEGWASWATSLATELASKLVYLRPSLLTDPDILVIEPISGYNWVVDACERTDLRNKIELSLRQWLNRPLNVQFRRLVENPVNRPARHPAELARSEGLRDEPLHERLVELFEARLVKIEVEDDPTSTGP